MLRKIGNFVHEYFGWLVTIVLIGCFFTFMAMVVVGGNQARHDNEVLKEQTSVRITGTILNVASGKEGQIMEIVPDGQIETVIVSCNTEALCPFLAKHDRVSVVTFQWRDVWRPEKLYAEGWRRA